MLCCKINEQRKYVSNMQNRNMNITRNEKKINKKSVTIWCCVVSQLLTIKNFSFPLRQNSDLISQSDFKVNTNISRRERRNVLLHSVDRWKEFRDRWQSWRLKHFDKLKQSCGGGVCVLRPKLVDLFRKIHHYAFWPHY